MGEDLDTARIARLESAIRIITVSLRGAGSLDRTLAAELHILGFEILRQSESWASHGPKISQTVFDSIRNLERAVEDLFFDISR